METPEKINVNQERVSAGIEFENCEPREVLEQVQSQPRQKESLLAPRKRTMESTGGVLAEFCRPPNHNRTGKDVVSEEKKTEDSRLAVEEDNLGNITF